VTFIDRSDAGRRLAGLLESRLRAGDVVVHEAVVLGLPRGGVPVGAEVAGVLRAPLDVLVVRKLGVPFQPELAFGAIGEQGVRVINDEVVRSLRLSAGDMAQVEAREREELERRSRRYRGERPPAALEGRTAVIVDDGVATGSTARAACLIARAQGATRIVLAVPVAPRGWVHRLTDVADELVSVDTPRSFFAIGQFYEDFAPTTDEEVRDCLRQKYTAESREPVPESKAGPKPGAGPEPGPQSQRRERPAPAADPEVAFSTRSGKLAGQLVTPADAGGVVLFAHGSGSSRHSPRNRFVAEELNRAGLATLLLDLLTEQEARDRANVFDTALLAERLHDATDWVRDWLPDLPVGYFGASTGAAAALLAAADPDCPVRAIVSRGGRPDLATPRLPEVTAPTLLIVGGRDGTVLDLNRQAQAMLRCENRLDVVPGATHLFEEPGTLEKVAELAAGWFATHLRDTAGAGRRVSPAGSSR
jgi:putative phosphoribosyl transferase